MAHKIGYSIKLPYCEHKNPHDVNFCNKCSRSLTKHTKAKAVPIEAEQKRTTAVFADLSGYTAMASTLDPEEVEMMNDKRIPEINLFAKEMRAHLYHKGILHE